MYRVCGFGLKSRKYIVNSFPKDTAEIETEWQKSTALGLGKQKAKTWFRLEKYKEY